MKILITGGTGLLGREISKQLLAKGHEVVFLSRNPKKDSIIPQFEWAPEEEYLDPLALKGVDCVINLAGAPINHRWTQDYKKQIISSRTASLKSLYKSLISEKHQVKMLISASAVGYYPHSFTEKYQEEDSPGSSFLSNVCKDWEKAALNFEQLNIKTSIIRIGIVLSEKGGALKEMLKPFKLGLGSPLASGKQWMPWIHIQDISGIFIFIAENERAGIFNGVGMEGIRNADFSKLLAKSLRKPYFAPNVPRLALKILMGESSAIALHSTNVDSGKIQKAGFEFKFKKLEAALKDLT